MDQKELEIQVRELEEKLDRLRSLYEQYFLGFEKIEPTIPRKDVERRFALLRKDQIRNTAIRFRVNVATQKFNTYAMYWGRICRQIEEGTYKRHLARAEKRFGKAAARGKRDESEVSFDVDMAELEDVDMEAVLAEANEAARALEKNDEPDTIPPPPPAADVPIASRSLKPVPVPVPPGSKGRIVLRKVAKPGEPPAPPASSAPMPAAAPAARPPMQSAPDLGSQRRIAVATPSSPIAPAARPPMQSSPDLGSQRKIIVRPRAPTDPGSAAKMPVGAPARPPAQSSPDLGSQPRVPGAPPGSAPRFPMPPPPPSARRLPVPAPDSEPSGERKSVPPPPKVRVPLPLPSQVGRTKKDS